MKVMTHRGRYVMAAPGPSFAAAGRDAIECAIHQPGSWSEKVITASCLKAGRDRQAKHHNFNPKLEMTKLVQIARPVEHDANHWQKVRQMILVTPPRGAL